MNPFAAPEHDSPVESAPSSLLTRALGVFEIATGAFWAFAGALMLIDRDPDADSYYFAAAYILLASGLTSVFAGYLLTRLRLGRALWLQIAPALMTAITVWALVEHWDRLKG